MQKLNFHKFISFKSYILKINKDILKRINLSKKNLALFLKYLRLQKSFKTTHAGYISNDTDFHLCCVPFSGQIRLIK